MSRRTRRSRRSSNDDEWVIVGIVLLFAAVVVLAMLWAAYQWVVANLSVVLFWGAAVLVVAVAGAVVGFWAHGRLRR